MTQRAEDVGVFEGEATPCPACGSTRVLFTVDDDGHCFWQWDCGHWGQTGRYWRGEDGKGCFEPDPCPIHGADE